MKSDWKVKNSWVYGIMGVFILMIGSFLTGCSGNAEVETPESQSVVIDGDELLDNAGGLMDSDDAPTKKPEEPNGSDTAEKPEESNESDTAQKPEEPSDSGTSSEPQSNDSDVTHPEGDTVETRFGTPDGYTRIEVEEGSFGRFVRNYPLKADGSPVLLYDGSEKGNQDVHMAVFAMSIKNEDLQQCADSIMKMYAEYFYESNQPERIKFHFTNGFLFEYEKWRDGGRLAISGNDISWSNSAGFDDSFENLQAYLRMTFIYAGTASMAKETTEGSMTDLQIGDVFIRGGSPGHVCMVADICEKDGKKAFLLAQGYMPAQEFHILKNMEHEEDPWYYEDEIGYPFITPEYVFDSGSLKHLTY